MDCDYDAEFIAHSRQDIPDLIDEIRRLKEALVETAEVLESYIHRLPYSSVITPEAASFHKRYGTGKKATELLLKLKLDWGIEK